MYQTIFTILSFVVVQWLAGHSNIPSHDLTDRAAKDPTTIASHTYHPTSLSYAFQVINEQLHYVPPAHVKTKEDFR